jgi:hypothetical protein
MSEFVQIHCHLSNGLVLRTFDEVKGPFDMVSHLEKDRFELRPGLNQVPVAFMDAWMAANSDNDFVKQKFIERTE